MPIDILARGANTAHRQNLASKAPRKGASLIGMDSGGTVRDRINWVTPESFGAIGDGSVANASIDTSALQQAVNSGKPVLLRPGAIYQINAEIRPPDGTDLVISGHRNTGDKQSVLNAAPGFKGWMLRPKASYDIRDVKLNGNNLDGCYLIGSPDAASAGIARIERVYVANADIGIFFDTAWNHPWGLYYNQIVGVGFRTGGINLGGTSGAGSSGESAWTMDNININGSPSGNGIVASDVVITPGTPDSTHDTIAWNNDAPPRYGWCVMRSADGRTGWHVPPNWVSGGLSANTFSASKTAGENWQYAVVRMTRGVSIRRGKAIWAGVVQSEYFGIGLYFQDIVSADVRQYYAETRDRFPPLPQFCGIFAANSNVSIGGGWVEQLGYGLIAASNGRINLTGPFRTNNCRWGKAAIGGATTQAMRLFGDLMATGTTPNTIVPLTGSAYDYTSAGVEHDTDNAAMTSYVDGAGGSGYSVRRRGVTKGRFYANTSGYSQLEAEYIKIAQPGKSALVPIVNKNYTTAITPGASTPFMTLSGLPTNSAAAASLFIQIVGRDASSVVRQSQACRLDISLIETAGTGVVASVVSSSPVAAIQLGTMGGPVFATSATNGTVMLTCTVNSSMPSLSLYAVPIVGTAEAQTINMVQS
ncbi:hypothetical protein BV97_02191 [Novosphingobium resinovorum]|uniref:Pectate lyase superfamily protein domain-containing protein n=1 Tax=Novosphingobium resinovorum TaxID=158500 RepID=A0A031JZE9_9SPHN|nr:hypothetical protein [Novosphingobium resinovorum]EZP82168.1 hypothetical protein BV97_02191 [Novosphingobium resinovorum]